MPAYSFEALDPQGQTRRGVLEAETARHARSQLRAQDWVPLKIDVQHAAKTGLQTVIWESQVFGTDALAVWTRQLAGLVDAGLPLERALSTLAQEAETPRQRDLVSDLRTQVNAGSPFAKALAQHPREFSAIYLAVIAAGEQSGHLGMVLERLADDLQAQQNLRNKLLAATLYPAIVSVVAMAIVFFLLTYVVPQVAQVFNSNQQALPWLTTLMLGVSALVQAMWLWGFTVGRAQRDRAAYGLAPTRCTQALRCRMAPSAADRSLSPWLQRSAFCQYLGDVGCGRGAYFESPASRL